MHSIHTHFFSTLSVTTRGVSKGATKSIVMMSVAERPPRPEDDIFSEGYLDEFYKTHVASRRSSLDEDIAAIEAEITKVHRYRHKCRRYRVEEHQLNSCGNSECSDDEENQMDSVMSCNSHDMEMLPTSVFKIYNSSISSPVGGPAGGDVRSKDESNVFTWAEYQLVSHDHSYSSNNANDQEEKRIHVDHGDPLTLNNVQWCQLTASRRMQALRRLSSILSKRPDPDTINLPGSFSLLPQPLVDLLRANNGVVNQTPPAKGPPALDKSMLIKLSHETIVQSLISASPSIKAKRKVTQRSTQNTAGGYQSESKRPRPIEITRVRYSSSCSETDAPLEVD